MIIYKATNEINGKSYIGQTVRTLSERKKEHIETALKMRDGKNYFHWAIVEYGEENFKWEILDRSDNQNKLNELEKFYIKNFRTNDNRFGYNGTQGGQGEIKQRKLVLLMNSWVRGTIKLSTELKRKGYEKDLLRKYLKSRWLESLGYGAYKLAGDDVKWFGAISVLQDQKNVSIHPGGKTALEIKGYAHYLSQNHTNIQLYGNISESLPKWFTDQDWKVTLSYIQTKLFGDDTKKYLSDSGMQNVKIKVSTPEMASMEMLHLVPKGQSFDEAMKIMEGLTTLRPKMVQELLEKCNSVKVKRLFLYMAEKSQHVWLKELELNKVSLGSGKRVVVQNGVLDNKYNITVPREYAE
jgi:group I intron endonuclease